MHHFVIACTAKCTKEGVNYVIHTSIYAFVYRIEVYKNEVLVNTIEVDCVGKSKTKMTYQSFMEIYQEAHKEIRDKYCQVQKGYTYNNEVGFVSKKSKFFTKKQNANSFKKTTVWIIVLGVIGYYFITKIVVYSDLYIDWMFPKKEKKIAYLEQAEVKTGYLGEECTFLAKNKLSVKSIVTKKNCHVWCDKNIIKKEKCDLFLAYFSNKIDVKEIRESSAKVRTLYEVYPKEDSIELKILDVYPMQVKNKSNQKILITLVDIILENSNYEEIVQFKGAITSLLIPKLEDKSFNIFLEPSYYKQFKPAKYTGELLFSVTQGSKIIGDIKKQFYFVIE